MSKDSPRENKKHVEAGPASDRTPDAGQESGKGNTLRPEAAADLSSRGGNRAHGAAYRRAEATSGRQTTELDIVAEGDATARKPRRRLQSDKPPAEMAKPEREQRAALVDKTRDHADKFKGASDKGTDRPVHPPKITVGLEDKREGRDKPEAKEPHFVVRKNGDVEMRGDPEEMKSKQIRVVLERDQGDLNPTEAQSKAADELVTYLNDRMKKNYPNEADKIQLDDRDDVISRQTEARLRPPPAFERMTPETRESVGQTRRLSGSGGVDMPRAATDGMGSFDTRGVPRQARETDNTAALKEAAAGLFRPDKDHPYETVRRHPDGDYRVGRYGTSGNQLDFFADWLSSLSPEEIEKLIAEGKLPKSLADPKKLAEFVRDLKSFAQKIQSGQQPSESDIKTLLPKETQEYMAGVLIEQLGQNPAVGNDPGKRAAAMLSGKAPDQVTLTDLSSPGGEELVGAGKQLYDIATSRQHADTGAGSFRGDKVPEGARRDLIEQALQIAGEPVNESTVAAVNTIVKHESGWNPNARNNWDINAKNGVPSQGLAQTIPPTFNAHRDKSGQVEAAGHRNSILDPLANLVASVNYSQQRYGGIERVPGVVSTRRGGAYKPY